MAFSKSHGSKNALGAATILLHSELLSSRMPPKAGPSKGKGLIPESSQAPKCKIANDIRAITRLQDEAALLQGEFASPFSSRNYE